MESIRYTGRWLTFHDDRGWEYVSRAGNTYGVMVVPFSSRKETVLVEQLRRPFGKKCIEFPAGLVGDIAPENSAHAAARELEEETGFRATRYELVAHGTPSPGLSNELMDVYLATGLDRIGKGGGIHDEDIAVHVVPLAQIENFLDSCRDRGCVIDLKVYAGLHFLRRHGDQALGAGVDAGLQG
ncbi:MAG: hypothetical protein RL095_2671 [Verrucomicrobiota bacterium]|jgi:ADP-ribose pyrophosphatase